MTTSAASSYRCGPCELPPLGPVMEQVGEEEIRERLAGTVRTLRPGRGHRPPVLWHQPEPGNEEERA